MSNCPHGLDWNGCAVCQSDIAKQDGLNAARARWDRLTAARDAVVEAAKEWEEYASRDDSNERNEAALLFGLSVAVAALRDVEKEMGNG